LSSLLLLIVLVIVLIEQRLRMQPRYHAKPGREERIVLSRGRAWATSLYAALVLSAAFIVPALQLLVWSGPTMLDSPVWSYLWRSLALGAFAAILTAAVAVILAYISRNRRDLTTRVAIRFATFGYAIPGAVLAVGLFIPLAWLDEQVAQGLKILFDIEAGRILQGTLAIMLFAYLARFLAVNFNPVEAAMLRITQSTEEAARGLGLDSKRVLLRVHLPMLRGGVLTGALLVFVDVMKEMPITLMTRPFGWDTLAVRIFEMTSEGQWEQAAVPALALIAAGLVPIIWLSRHAEKS
jgi:iron(III) transport system permease protein